ncbi:Ada metal-binding domain-containing protein [Klebsiella quasipneumoniae]|uniref:Ada metal-binding domain-containing protein n=1 Tax=Klebsiella quasipneumoniae TaxID=1463165 RepID=UPI00388D77B5
MKPIVADTDDRRWQAVCERDTRADGQFVFAVLTTGICCRPSCRSRRARRKTCAFLLTSLLPWRRDSAPANAASRIKPARSSKGAIKWRRPVACWSRRRP